jgi:hypothetical protein
MPLQSPSVGSGREDPHRAKLDYDRENTAAARAVNQLYVLELIHGRVRANSWSTSPTSAQSGAPVGLQRTVVTLNCARGYHS